MILKLWILKLRNQTKDLEIENSSLQEDCCVIKLSKHLMAHSRVVEDDDDDHPVFPKVVKVKLLDYTLSFVEENKSFVPFFSVHVEQRVLVELVENNWNFIFIKEKLFVKCPFKDVARLALTHI